RLLRFGYEQRGRRRAAGHARRADDQRHALLPRNAPFRPCASGPAEFARAGQEWRAHPLLVGGVFLPRGALFVGAYDPGHDSQRGRTRYSRAGHGYRSQRSGARRTRRLPGESARGYTRRFAAEPAADTPYRDEYVVPYRRGGALTRALPRA